MSGVNCRIIFTLGQDQPGILDISSDPSLPPESVIATGNPLLCLSRQKGNPRAFLMSFSSLRIPHKILNIFRKISRDLYSICYDPNITTKVGTVGRICLDNLKDKWSPASLIHTLCQSRTSQAIKPLGKRTQLYAMNNIYIQSEYQVQITFFSYQECATFCLSNHWAIMTFK
uniref:UBC core domain-containing protein n=1 Tax=Malurus cyaneus samueli TaxID=2593467 RepID=A0A8C5THK8_9PASS